MQATKINVLVKNTDKHNWSTKDVSTLEDMQKIVGGLIERVQLPHNIDLWLNEEGMINGLDINIMILWSDNPAYQQPIYGPIFLASYDDNGETNSLTYSQKQWLVNNFILGRLSNGKQIIILDARDRGECK